MVFDYAASFLKAQNSRLLGLGGHGEIIGGGIEVRNAGISI
jgi:hypothetical protein